jgi:ectoine hydroxylase-related dioxygenase (phytanoyl-CoA dioxygenase family)
MIDVLSDGRRTFVDEVEPEARNRPYKLNDLYLIAESARRIFLHERIVRMASLILDDEVVGCNSLTFEYGSMQPAHIDHVYMTPPTPRRLVASWIALEDVRSDAGPLSLWPGSHRLPPFDFGGTYHYSPEKEEQHTKYVAEQAARFPELRFMAKKGDVLLWHALLVHGGSPIDDGKRTRKSMACHYFGAGDVVSLPRARLGRASYLRRRVDDAV